MNCFYDAQGTYKCQIVEKLTNTQNNQYPYDLAPIGKVLPARLGKKDSKCWAAGPGTREMRNQECSEIFGPNWRADDDNIKSNQDGCVLTGQAMCKKVK
jgi:hypothetical protein